MTDNIQMPNSLDQISSSRGISTISPEIISSEEKGNNVIKIILIIGAILFLAYNLFLYFTEGKDILEKYFGIKLFNSDEKEKKEEKTKELVDSVKEDNIKLDESQKKDKNETSPIENIMKEKGKYVPKLNKSDISKKKSGNIQADISTESDIQQSKKGNYCYIGTDRTYRTCVKMGEEDTCMSKQVFPTLQLCINPNLRS